jgi:hypothetical protein
LSSSEKKDPVGLPDFLRPSYVVDLTVYGSPLKMIAVGDQVVRDVAGKGITTTFYTVPAGKTAYLFYLFLFARNTSSTLAEGAEVRAAIGPTTYILLKFMMPPGGTAGQGVAFTFLRLRPGDSLTLATQTDVEAYACAVVVEV